MKTLTITITSVTETDYDGISETVKQVTGSIYDDVTQVYELESNKETVSVENTLTDAQAKDVYKSHLTNKQYTWDSES